MVKLIPLEKNTSSLGKYSGTMLRLSGGGNVFVIEKLFYIKTGGSSE